MSHDVGTEAESDGIGSQDWLRSSDVRDVEKGQRPVISSLGPETAPSIVFLMFWCAGVRSLGFARNGGRNENKRCRQ